MIASKLNMIWASMPGCSRPVAEVWIERECLWMTLFIDDADGGLKIELLPSPSDTTAYFVHFVEAERLIETAKRELLAMCVPSD